jgi:hypothetical protein
MAINGSVLGQLRPANTTAASVYSPAASTEAQITAITVCNTSGAAATMRIFLDDNGTTYDQTTALYYDVPVAADDTVSIFFERGIFMNDATGNLAVRTSVADALTFTVWGLEKA